MLFYITNFEGLHCLRDCAPPLTFVGDFLEQVGDNVVEGGAAARADHRVCKYKLLFYIFTKDV